MMEEENTNRVLIAVDASNFEYVALNSAAYKWYGDHKNDDAANVRAPSKTDQDNLPNILVFDSYRRILHREILSRLEYVSTIARNFHQNEIDNADGIDIIFAEDSHVSGNFRRRLYPQYKAQRRLVKQSYNVPVIKEYIQDVLFKELDIENSFGYKTLKIEGCECDDIIAVLMRNHSNYACRIVISSDRDFLQLEGVHQYDMWGREVKFKIAHHEDLSLTPMEFLYWKIVRGDVSDNIKNVFAKVGDVKSYNLVKDKATLKKMLTENQEAADRFLLNKKLIDFREIPKEMEEKILKAIEEKLGTPSQKEEVEKFSVESCLSI